MIRVGLPQHLRTLAKTGKEVELRVEGPATLGAILDTLEAQYPVLRGTIRDQVSQQRRPFIRYFACGTDWSLLPTQTVLPESVATGTEPFRVVAAMAGG